MVTIDNLKNAGLFQEGKVDEIYKAVEAYDINRLLVILPVSSFEEEDTEKALSLIYVTPESSSNKVLDLKVSLTLSKVLEKVIGIPIVVFSYHEIIESAALLGPCAEGGLKLIKHSIAIDALVPWLSLEEQSGNRQAPPRQIAETKAEQQPSVQLQFGSGSPFQKLSSPKPLSPVSNSLSFSQIQEAIKQFNSDKRHQLMEWLLANYPEDLNSSVFASQGKRKAGSQEGI